MNKVNPEDIREMVADALFQNLENVQFDSNLVMDLGAQSIDFLDIVFRIESKYNVRVPRGEIDEMARQDSAQGDASDIHTLTEDAIAGLKRKGFSLDYNRLQSGTEINDLPSFFTVQTFVEMANRAIENGESLEGMVAQHA